MQQIVALRRHGLNAVDGQEVLSFAGFQRQTLGVVEALELAVVFVQVVMAGREAARREGKRNLAKGEDLGFNSGWPAAVQGVDQGSRGLERRHPALQAEAGKGGQGFLVVDIEVRSGDEVLAGSQIDRAQVVGFKLAACFIDQSAQCLQIAFRFEQGLGGDDDFLAGIGQVARQTDPVGGAKLLAARADDLANVDDVEGRVLRHVGVELHDFGLGPEIEQGSERQFHA